MNEASNALPPHLKAAADVIDDSEVPADRPYPRWHTPPIKGFKINDYVKTDED